MTLKRILAVGAAMGTAIALAGVAIAQSTEAPATAVMPTEEAPVAVFDAARA